MKTKTPDKKRKQSYTLQEVMEKLDKNLKERKPAPKNHKIKQEPERALYQTLCSHTLSEILPTEDINLLDRYASKTNTWYPPFFQEKPLFKTMGNPKIFLLLETGANFSEEYQKKTLEHFKTLGFSKTFLKVLEASQIQMINTLILSPLGCYPDPRKPKTLKSITNPNPFEKDIEHFHTLYPIELLTTILNSRCNQKRKKNGHK
jgi:hypothetical protein